MMRQLAQLNIAQLKAPLDSPLLVDFVDNLDRINALADTFDGFVWRLQTEDGDATALRPFGDNVIVNLSVWRDLDALRNFVYQSPHVEIFRRGAEWFERTGLPMMVLWWIDEAQIPTIDEAQHKLALLRKQGASPDAFTFAQPY